MKRIKSLIGVLLVLMMLGSVIGTLIAIMAVSDTIGKDIREANIKKEIPNTKILNTVNDLRSNYEVYVANENVLKGATAVELYSNLAKRVHTKRIH